MYSKIIDYNLRVIIFNLSFILLLTIMKLFNPPMYLEITAIAFWVIGVIYWLVSVIRIYRVKK